MHIYTFYLKIFERVALGAVHESSAAVTRVMVVVIVVLV